MAKPGRGGAAYLKAREQMFAKYGDTCHICGHGGAKQADHLVPVVQGETRVVTADDLRPAHGGNRQPYDNPCPTCGQRCNQRRRDGTVQEGQQRVAQGFTGYRPSREW